MIGSFTKLCRNDSEYLLCLDAENGQEIWRSEAGPFFKELVSGVGDGPRSMPTVDGDVVYALSANGHLFAATAQAGATIWKIDVKQKFEFDPPKLWYGFSSSPFIDRNMLLLNVGAVLLQMQRQSDSLSVREVWKSGVMSNHFQTSILLGKYLYGFDDGTFKCIEAETGKEMWAKRRLGKGSLIYADGMLIVLSERGQLVLAEANPQQYVELASAPVLTGRTWTPPSLANGKLYLRHQSEMVCLKLK